VLAVRSFISLGSLIDFKQAMLFMYINGLVVRVVLAVGSVVCTLAAFYMQMI